MDLFQLGLTKNIMLLLAKPLFHFDISKAEFLSA